MNNIKDKITEENVSWTTYKGDYCFYNDGTGLFIQVESSNEIEFLWSLNQNGVLILKYDNEEINDEYLRENIAQKSDINSLLFTLYIKTNDGFKEVQNILFTKNDYNEEYKNVEEEYNKTLNELKDKNFIGKYRQIFIFMIVIFFTIYTLVANVFAQKVAIFNGMLIPIVFGSFFTFYSIKMIKQISTTLTYKIIKKKKAE